MATFLLCLHVVGRKTKPSGVSSDKDINLNTRAPPSRPRLTPVNSPKSHLLIPSPRRLGLQCMNFGKTQSGPPWGVLMNMKWRRKGAVFREGSLCLSFTYHPSSLTVPETSYLMSATHTQQAPHTKVVASLTLPVLLPPVLLPPSPTTGEEVPDLWTCQECACVE